MSSTCPGPMSPSKFENQTTSYVLQCAATRSEGHERIFLSSDTGRTTRYHKGSMIMIIGHRSHEDLDSKVGLAQRNRNGTSIRQLRISATNRKLPKCDIAARKNEGIYDQYVKPCVLDIKLVVTPPTQIRIEHSLQTSRGRHETMEAPHTPQAPRFVHPGAQI